MLTKSNIKNIYPLSGMQEGLFFHFLLDKHSSAYFVQFSYSIQGALQSDLVEQSLNELMQRYDILRTVFVNNHDRLLQVVLKERPIDFAVFTMEQGASLEMKQDFVAQYRQKDRERSFDITKDVLMRVTLLQLDTCEY